MGKWLIKLKGEKFDLEDLPLLLQSQEISIIEDNGSYYLKSSEFDSFNSAEEVRERGLALIKILNGVAKLYRDNWQDVALDCVTFIKKNGGRHNYIYLQANITERSKTSTVTCSGVPPAVGQLSQLKFLYRLAQKHKSVADALHFYRDDSWFNLYKVYEIIRDDIGGKHILVRNAWISKPVLSRFTQTAQSRAALGDYARHAIEKYKPPPKPMSLSQARSLIKSVLIKWITTK